MLATSGHSRLRTALVLCLLLILPLGIHSQNLDFGEELKKLRDKRVIMGENVPDDTQFKTILVCVTEDVCPGPDTSKQLIESELKIRNRFRSLRGPCTRDLAAQPILEPADIIPRDISYVNWQNSLFRRGDAVFCDPFQHLYCHGSVSYPKGIKEFYYDCQCLPGTEWIQDIQQCVISTGGACVYNRNKGENQPYGNARAPRMPTYYDPLSPQGMVKTQTILGPSCGPPTTDRSCSQLSYFDFPICVAKDDLFVSGTVGHREYFKKVSDLTFGQDCDADLDKQLFTHDSDNRGSRERLEKLQDLQTGGKHFCNVTKFLTCGPGSSKCECISPAASPPGGGDCAFPPEYAKCGGAFTASTAFFRGIAFVHFVPEARVLIAQGFEAIPGSCDRKLECYYDYRDLGDVHVFCACPKGKAGDNCDEELTSFLTRALPPTYANDQPSRVEKANLFVDFNNAAKIFETIFKIPAKGKCNPAINELAVQRAVIRIRKLDKSSTVMTKSDYKMLTEDINRLSSNYLDSGVCDSIKTPGLVCNKKTSECGLPNLMDRVKEVIDQLRTFETGHCNSSCIQNVKPFGEYKDFPKAVEELERLLARDFIQFCNGSMSATCGRDGICECRPGQGPDGKKGSNTACSCVNLQIVQILSILAVILYLI